MGERKVLNKYIPADFDPKLVPRSKKPKDELVSVRMMLPFTIQCSTCSSFMYRGRKFNSKKESVKGSEGKYLGIQRYRFYIKCTACSRPLTFLTDPENADYEMESGGTRTYEVHKDKDRIKQDLEREEAKNEKEDPMKALENRVLASQREMADLDNLDEIKAMNMRHLKMMASGAEGAEATKQILDAHHKVESNTIQSVELDDSDEEMIRNIKFGQNKNKNNLLNQNGSTAQSGVLRLTEKEEQELERQRKLKEKLLVQQQMELSAKAASRQNHAMAMDATNPLLVVKVKRKRRVPSEPNNDTNGEKKTKVKENMEEKTKENCPAIASNQTAESALGLLSGYGSDSDSD